MEIEMKVKGLVVDPISKMPIADKEADMFTFRRKYMPTDQVRTHTPPHLPAEIVQVRALS